MADAACAAPPWPGLGLGPSWLPVLRGQDRLVRGVGVRREDLGQPLLAERPGEAGAGQLVVVVAVQVPGHRLEPGQGVHRRPRLDPVVRHLLAQHGVLERHPGGGAHGGDVGVDPVGVGLEVLPRRGGQLRQLGLGDSSPAHRPDHLVGLQATGADHLGEPARGDVPAQVHLEEPVLGGDVALGPEQVLGVVGVDLRHALLVAQHVHRRREPTHVQRARGLGERAADQPDPDHRDDDGDDDHEGDQGHSDTAGSSHAGHPARLGHRTSPVVEAGDQRTAHRPVPRRPCRRRERGPRVHAGAGVHARRPQPRAGDGRVRAAGRRGRGPARGPLRAALPAALPGASASPSASPASASTSSRPRSPRSSATAPSS